MKKMLLVLFAMMFVLGTVAAPVFAGCGGDCGTCPLPDCPPDGDNGDDKAGCDGDSCPIPPDCDGDSCPIDQGGDDCDGGSCPIPPDGDNDGDDHGHTGGGCGGC